MGKNGMNMRDNQVRTWRGFVGLVDRYNPNFELKTNLKYEREVYEDKHGMLQEVLDIVPMRVLYCNRTGQPIGLLADAVFSDKSIASSIATQWLSSGPEALKKHIVNEPIAYTVYLMGSCLRRSESLEDVKNEILIKASLYAVLMEVNDSSLISALQTALWVQSKSNAKDALTKSPAIMELDSLTKAMLNKNVLDNLNNPEVIKLFKLGLNIWLANVFGRLTEQTMPTEYSQAELMLHNAIKARDMIDGSTLNRPAFSNILPEQKPKSPAVMNALKSQVKVAALNEALGDIFG